MPPAWQPRSGEAVALPTTNSTSLSPPRRSFGKADQSSGRLVIESVFATVRHRTVHTKDALSQHAAQVMVFKLAMAASRTWCRLEGGNQLPRIVQGVTFRNGVEITNTPAQDAA